MYNATIVSEGAKWTLVDGPFIQTVYARELIARVSASLSIRRLTVKAPFLIGPM